MFHKRFLFFVLFSLTSLSANADYIKSWDQTLVKESPDKTAKTLDVVYRGQFISIIKSDKDWAYIKYVKFQKYYYGWVENKTITSDYPMTSTKPNENAYYKAFEEMRDKLHEEEKNDPRFQELEKLHQQELSNLEQEYIECLAIKSEIRCDSIKRNKKVNLTIKNSERQRAIRDEYSRRFSDENTMLKQIHNFQPTPLYPTVNVHIIN